MKELGLALLIIAIVALIIVGPFAFIWALNTLFPLAIGYTWKTWIASFIVLSVIGLRTGINSRKSD